MIQRVILVSEHVSLTSCLRTPEVLSLGSLGATGSVDQFESISDVRYCSTGWSSDDAKYVVLLYRNLIQPMNYEEDPKEDLTTEYAGLAKDTMERKQLQVALWGCALGWGHEVAPLALIGESPLSVARTMVQVPLVLVPRNDLTLYSNVHINSVSHTQPIVRCSLNSYTLDATPAVRVVLRQPIVVESPEALLPFPAQISVLHEGLRMSIPVGALIAPVPTQFHGPQIIRVMYAIPTSPLRLQYPYRPPVPYPLRPDFIEVPKPQVPKPTKPSEIDDLLGNKKPSYVTVLDFPSEISTPQALYYQPPVEDELGNRGPPEAIIPAGIVQSAQPRPSLQLFLNSKESPLLQSLRNQANINRESSPNAISVEAL